MGSEFLTIMQAAARLQKTSKTVRAYMKRGILRRQYDPENRRVLIPSQDVEALFVELGLNAPPMNRKTFFQLHARVQRLEMEMAVAKKALGFGGVPLRPTREEAVGLYQMARRALLDSSWVIEEIEMWSGLFERMDDVFFDLMMTHTEGDCWQSFYELCLSQMRQLNGAAEFQTSLRLQEIHLKLAQALKQIRQVIIILIETGHGQKSASAAGFMAGPKDALLHHLEEKERSVRE